MYKFIGTIGNLIRIYEDDNSISFFHTRHHHYISFNPSATNEGIPLYVLCRIGGNKWKVECNNGFLYNMQSLRKNRACHAPIGLKGMARKCFKYIEELGLTDDEIKILLTPTKGEEQ